MKRKGDNTKEKWDKAQKRGVERKGGREKGQTEGEARRGREGEP